MPIVDVQNITDTKDEDRGVGAVNKAPTDITNISMTMETIMLVLAEEKKDEDDNFQEEPPRKAARRSYDSWRKFQLL